MSIQEDSEEWRHSEDLKAVPQEHRFTLVVHNRWKGKTVYDADKLEAIRRQRRDQ